MYIQNKTKEYYHDAHLIWSCQYHIIFCTKYRRKVLENGIDQRLKEIVLENQTIHKYKIIEIEVMPDHVHALIEVNPKVGVHKAISIIKGLTSNILRKEFKQLRSRLPTLWTHGKFVSTVGSVSLEVIKKYIEDQKNK